MKKLATLMTLALSVWSAPAFSSAHSAKEAQEGELFTAKKLNPCKRHPLQSNDVTYFATALKKHLNWDSATHEQLDEIYQENVSPSVPSMAYYAIKYTGDKKIVGVMQISPFSSLPHEFRTITWSFGRQQFTPDLKDRTKLELDTNVLPTLIRFAFTLADAGKNAFQALSFALPMDVERKAEYAPFQALDPALNPFYRYLKPGADGMSGDYFKARYFDTDHATGAQQIIYTLSREDAARMEEARLAKFPKKED